MTVAERWSTVKRGTDGRCLQPLPGFVATGRLTFGAAAKDARSAWEDKQATMPTLRARVVVDQCGRSKHEGANSGLEYVQ